MKFHDSIVNMQDNIMTFCDNIMNMWDNIMIIHHNITTTKFLMSYPPFHSLELVRGHIDPQTL